MHAFSVEISRLSFSSSLIRSNDRHSHIISIQRGSSTRLWAILMQEFFFIRQQSTFYAGNPFILLPKQQLAIIIVVILSQAMGVHKAALAFRNGHFAARKAIIDN